MNWAAQTQRGADRDLISPRSAGFFFPFFSHGDLSWHSTIGSFGVPADDDWELIWLLLYPFLSASEPLHACPPFFLCVKKAWRRAEKKGKGARDVVLWATVQ